MLPLQPNLMELLLSFLPVKSTLRNQADSDAQTRDDNRAKRLSYPDGQPGVREAQIAVQEHVGVFSVLSLGADDVDVVAATKLDAVQGRGPVLINLLLDPDDHRPVGAELPLPVGARAACSHDQV